MTRLELATIIMEAMVHRFGQDNVILEKDEGILGTDYYILIFDPPTKEQLQYYLREDEYFHVAEGDAMTYEQTVEYYHNNRDETGNEHWLTVTIEEGR
jgi:hypothetical protein